MAVTIRRIARVTALVVAAAGLTGMGVTGAAGAQTAYPDCHTSQLSVWRAEPGDGAAGSVYYDLQFSNISRSTCSLLGFPGVTGVNSHGSQVGAAAARDHRFAPSRVVLRPGVTAHAVLRIVDVANFPTASCGATSVTALRIYPPNTTRAKMLSFSFKGCSKRASTYLYVRTIRSGAGIPGYSE